MKLSDRQFPVIFLIPALFLLFCLYLKSAAGPFYLGNNNDPAYLYLVSSLYLLDGLTPGFIQHPGTTLQILGAIIIRLMAGPVPFDLLLENVYKNPEFFLHGIYYGLLAMNTISIVLLGWYVLLRSNRIFWAFLVQSSAVLALSWNFIGVAQGNIPVVVNVSAENLLIALTNFYGLLLLKMYFDQKEGRVVRPRCWAAVLGILCAAGLVTKTLFLAWALAPFFLIKDRKEKAVFVLMFLTSVGIWTIPIWPNLDHLMDWYGTVMTHTGSSGEGAKGFVDFGTLGRNFLSLMRDNAFFCFVWAGIYLMAMGSLFRIFRNRLPAAPDALAFRYVLVLCSAVFVTMLLIARQTAAHYIVPTVNLLGVLCFFACQAWLIKEGIMMRAVLILLILLNTGSSLWAGTKLAGINAENQAFSKKAYSEYGNCVVCGYYRSSSPAFALQFGDENQGHLAYVDVLKKMYPDTVFYHYWNRYFYDGRDIINYEDLKLRYPCIMLYGSRLPEEFNTKFIKVREIASSLSEGLYNVERVTIEEALEASIWPAS